MLNQLLETKQVTQRRAGGTMVSVVLHVIVIAGAVGVTQRNVGALTKPVETRVVVYQPLKPAPEPVHTAPASASAPPTHNSPLGSQTLTAPVTIELGIPPVDLGATPTNAADWTGVGAPGGRPDGLQGAAATVATDAPMTDRDVDKAAAAIAGSPVPAYPEMLKASGVEGEALVQFVVDTLGRAELGSFTVLEATHDAFGSSVRATLARMRFLPAESGGKKVRMLVRQRFAFALNR
jgi:periplasmic protein TonB